MYTLIMIFLLTYCRCEEVMEVKEINLVNRDDVL